MIIVYMMYGFVGTMLLAMLLMCVVGAFMHCCRDRRHGPPPSLPSIGPPPPSPQQTKEPAPPPPMTTITIVVQPDGTVGTVGAVAT